MIDWLIDGDADGGDLNIGHENKFKYKVSQKTP